MGDCTGSTATGRINAVNTAGGNVLPAGTPGPGAATPVVSQLDGTPAATYAGCTGNPDEGPTPVAAAVPERATPASVLLTGIAAPRRRRAA